MKVVFDENFFDEIDHFHPNFDESVPDPSRVHFTIVQLTCAKKKEPAVDGGSIAPGEFVGCVFLEVDDHLMGGPERAHHESMERLRQRIKFGKWHQLLQDGPSFSEDATSHSYLIEASRLT